MRNDWREPFFLAFVIVALVVVLLVWVRRPDNDGTDASYQAAVAAGEPTPTARPLPTPIPTPVPDETPSEAYFDYAADGIVLTGDVLAQPVADALAAAARFLVGPDLVDDQLRVVDDPELNGTRLTIRGVLVDEAERARVISSLTGIGVLLNDEMTLESETRTIVEVVAETPELAQFDGFLAASSLLDVLGDPGSGVEYTLFAPSDDALLALDTATIDVLKHLELLTDVVGFHVVEGALTSSDLAGVDSLTTLQGASLPVEVDTDGLVHVGDGTLTTVDLPAANGIVHVIDTVQIPPTVGTEVALNRLVELDPIEFAPGSATILEESLPILEEAARLLNENPGTPVEIQGHTDTDGDEQLNLELSQQRADAVLAFLVDAGVDASRLTAVGYGETRLKVDPEVTSADKAANRRIEFRIDR